MLSGEDAPGYRVLGTAGQGGFGVVYKAYQERLDRVVALKVLTVDRVDARTMRRFQRELQLTGRLTGHPNVVTVFDTGTTRSGKPYIAMEFFENGSLRDRVRAQGPLPVADVLRTGVKLAAALAAVHEAGVLHGDIKPQNILISRYGEPAIADFGVARVPVAKEPQSKPAEIDKAARDALAPRRLRLVADRGAVVTLRWTLPAHARRYPLILQREPADGQQLASLKAGDTMVRVVGLDPDSGYCFLVGAALEISQKSTVAWSKPYCIRGAVTR
ncbi:serine/threonine-protein kinase [Nonomuraea sp. NPDC049152]|uniref:serine/threonine-protein kinase n=1 Tax=Nonomuraea sp. NPDC049152 TaxID=3154350 RepID=UPI0033FFB683